MEAHPFPRTIRDNLLPHRRPENSPEMLTSTQTAFVMLDEVIKMVNRRGRSRLRCLSVVLALTRFIVNAMYYSLHTSAASSTSLTCRTASTSSFLGRRIPSNVNIGMGTLALPSWDANLDLDINAELDELDREEFYRLKKVRTDLQRQHGWRLTRRVGCQEEGKGQCCPGRRTKGEAGGRSRDGGDRRCRWGHLG